MMVGLAVLVLAQAAPADYIDLPVKWSQTPWDPNAGAYWSDHTRTDMQVMADDFLCESTEPIVAVRW